MANRQDRGGNQMLDDRDIAVLNRIAEALEALVPLLQAMTEAQAKLSEVSEATARMANVKLDP